MVTNLINKHHISKLIAEIKKIRERRTPDV